MCYRTYVSVVLSLAIAGPLSADSAFATSISVDVANASFELQNVDDGKDSAAATPAGWTTTIGGGTAYGDAWVGVWNPTSADFANAGGNGTPQGGEGSKIVAFYLNGGNKRPDPPRSNGHHLKCRNLHAYRRCRKEFRSPCPCQLQLRNYHLRSLGRILVWLNISEMEIARI